MRHTINFIQEVDCIIETTIEVSDTLGLITVNNPEPGIKQEIILTPTFGPNIIPSFPDRFKRCYRIFPYAFRGSPIFGSSVGMVDFGQGDFHSTLVWKETISVGINSIIDLDITEDITEPNLGNYGGPIGATQVGDRFNNDFYPIIADGKNTLYQKREVSNLKYYGQMPNAAILSTFMQWLYDLALWHGFDLPEFFYYDNHDPPNKIPINLAGGDVAYDKLVKQPWSFENYANDIIKEITTKFPGWSDMWFSDLNIDTKITTGKYTNSYKFNCYKREFDKLIDRNGRWRYHSWMRMFPQNLVQFKYWSLPFFQVRKQWKINDIYTSDANQGYETNSFDLLLTGDFTGTDKYLRVSCKLTSGDTAYAYVDITGLNAGNLTSAINSISAGLYTVSVEKKYNGNPVGFYNSNDTRVYRITTISGSVSNLPTSIPFLVFEKVYSASPPSYVGNASSGSNWSLTTGNSYNVNIFGGGGADPQNNHDDSQLNIYGYNSVLTKKCNYLVCQTGNTYTAGVGTVVGGESIVPASLMCTIDLLSGDWFDTTKIDNTLSSNLSGTSINGTMNVVHYGPPFFSNFDLHYCAVYSAGNFRLPYATGLPSPNQTIYVDKIKLMSLQTTESVDGSLSIYTFKVPKQYTYSADLFQDANLTTTVGGSVYSSNVAYANYASIGFEGMTTHGPPSTNVNGLRRGKTTLEAATVKSYFIIPIFGESLKKFYGMYTENTECTIRLHWPKVGYICSTSPFNEQGRTSGTIGLNPVGTDPNPFNMDKSVRLQMKISYTTIGDISLNSFTNGYFGYGGLPEIYDIIEAQPAINIGTIDLTNTDPDDVDHQEDFIFNIPNNLFTASNQYLVFMLDSGDPIAALPYFNNNESFLNWNTYLSGQWYHWNDNIFLRGYTCGNSFVKRGPIYDKQHGLIIGQSNQDMFGGNAPVGGFEIYLDKKPYTFKPIMTVPT